MLPLLNRLEHDHIERVALSFEVVNHKAMIIIDQNDLEKSLGPEKLFRRQIHLSFPW